MFQVCKAFRQHSVRPNNLNLVDYTNDAWSDAKYLVCKGVIVFFHVCRALA